MSANLRKYEDYLEYLPEKERKAAEEALYTGSEEEPVIAIVRQLNRSKTVEPKRLKTAQKPF